VRFGMEIAELRPVALDLCDEDDSLASAPGRETDFRDRLEAALAFASGCGFSLLHVPGGTSGDMDVLAANLAHAAEAGQGAGVQVLIGISSAAGATLPHLEAAEALRQRIGSDRAWLLFDIFHAQRAGGNLSASFDRLKSGIGHVRLAGVPGGHEPDQGEVRHDWLLRHFDARGYKGWTGAAYKPAGRTEDGLGWANALREAR